MSENSEQIRDRLIADAELWLSETYPLEVHRSVGEINAIAFVSASQEIAALQQKINELQELA
jgi:hypothetical protein